MAVRARFDKLDVVPECPSAKPHKSHDASTDNVQNSSRRFCHYYSPSKGLRLSQWQPKSSWKEYQHVCVGFQSSTRLITGPKRNLHRDRQYNEQHFWLLNRPISSTSPSQGHWFHILFVISLGLLVQIHVRNFPSSDYAPKVLPRNTVPVCSHQTPQKFASLCVVKVLTVELIGFRARCDFLVDFIKFMFHFIVLTRCIHYCSCLDHSRTHRFLSPIGIDPGPLWVMIY